MNKSEKKFKRKCIVCSSYKIKEDMIRLTKQKGSCEVQINMNNDIQGHSFYICKEVECLEKALKSKVLIKYTKLNTTQNTIDFIKNILNFKKN